MQACWGAENYAPGPQRSGVLYGEEGRWMVNNTESIPDVFTRADPGVRGADDADTKFYIKEHTLKGPIQACTHKNPSEADLLPNGLHSGVVAHPSRMTMNDHDKGVVWPPPKGTEWMHAKFMGMVRDPPDRKNEVNGIMVGYKGHVPRARDKVGGSSFGGIVGARSGEGFPAPEETNPAYMPAYGAQTVHPEGEHPLYVSMAMSHGKSTVMASSGVPLPNGPTRTVEGNGYIPRFAGHKPGAYNQIGGSVYGAHAEGPKVVPESTFEYKTIHGSHKAPPHGRAAM